MIAAPHTTNWDFPIMLALTKVLRCEDLLVGQAVAVQAARWAQIMRWLGGVVDRPQRTRRHGVGALAQ
jgi:1-acyl-sn-glycerol-3-phosphate acyltransferase